MSTNILDALDWKSFTAPSTLKVFFAEGGKIWDDPYVSPTLTSGWDQFEIQQAKLAFKNFENVANVKFSYVDTIASADFVMVEGNFPPLGYWGVGGGTTSYDGISYSHLKGWGAFASTHVSWSDPANLAVGGYGYITLIHEIGHGMGLAHPHDAGGGSVVMNGVVSPFNSYGDFNLNQGIYTTMSYNDGWRLSPTAHDITSANFGYGWQGTLMALDIAMLQKKYGANMTHKTGNDTYVLPTANAPGTFYSAIWDAGGVDTIRHNGTAGAVIDLRPATIDYSATGGGLVSYVPGIHGGFTIAQKVVIENAIGGTGNDVITGNTAANTLTGNAGNDNLFGGNGNDILDGGPGRDVINGGLGIDTASYAKATGGVTASLLRPAANRGEATGDTYVSVENLTGSRFADTLHGNSGSNTILGMSGVDKLHGEAGSDKLYGGVGNDLLYGGSGVDRLHGEAGNDTAYGGTQNDLIDGGAGSDRLFGGAGDDAAYGGTGADRVYGDAGNDRLYGGSGNDSVYGGTGVDRLFGDAGNDLLFGGAGNDSVYGGAGNDRILGDAGNDKLYGDAGADKAYGGAGNDLIYGGASNDLLYGDAGNDRLFGGTGNDRLYGGLGVDRLFGDAGNDHLYGGRGNDELFGGAGTDYAYFTGKSVDYELTEKGGRIFVSHADGKGIDGVDTLVSVEFLVFADQTIAA